MYIYLYVCTCIYLSPAFSWNETLVPIVIELHFSLLQKISRPSPVFTSGGGGNLANSIMQAQLKLRGYSGGGVSPVVPKQGKIVIYMYV